jgi:hypothetical protein
MMLIQSGGLLVVMPFIITADVQERAPLKTAEEGHGLITCRFLETHPSFLSHRAHSINLLPYSSFV